MAAPGSLTPFGYSFKIESIQQIERIDKYYGMRFTTGNNKIRVLSFHTHIIILGLEEYGAGTGRFKNSIKEDGKPPELS